MDQQQKLPPTNESNGFFLGIIVGVAVTALFTTQKGKEILRDITDKSIESWDDVEKALEGIEADVDDSPTTEYVSPEEKREIKYLAQDAATSEESEKNEELPSKKVEAVKIVTSEKSPEKTIKGRRWFRGLKKRA